MDIIIIWPATWWNSLENDELSASMEWMSEHIDLSGWHQLMSETQCLCWNVGIRSAHLVMHLGFTLHLVVPFDSLTHQDSGYIMLNFPYLDCCKAFTVCDPANHHIYVLRHHPQPGIADIGVPVRNARCLCLCDCWRCLTDFQSADEWVTEWTWESLSGSDFVKLS